MMEKFSWNDQNVINVNIRLNDNIRLLEQGISTIVDQRFSSYPENQRNLLTRKFILVDNIDILNSKMNYLEQTLEKLDERINLIPTLESEIVELQNQVTNARRYRDAFKSEETTVGILSERVKERTKYKVIEPAQLPLEPFWPDKKKLLVMGLILGLILGGALILILELFDNSYKKVNEIEDELGVRVLGVISRLDKFNISR